MVVCQFCSLEPPCLPVIGLGIGKLFTVEKYLKETRGINNIDSPDIRYHPKVYTGKNEEQKYSPAMICFGRDKNGEVQCAQATYLDPKTANKANLDVKKRAYASPSGALVSLQDSDSSNKKEKGDLSFIAEGVETGLSIKDAVKNSDVVVTLGKSNFTSIDPESIGQKVIFCLDNDGAQSFKDGAIHKAAERLIARGKEVLISIPNQINHTKTDFNDIARAEGIGAVRKSIDDAISYKQFSEQFKVEKNISNNIDNSFTDKTKTAPDLTKQQIAIKEQRGGADSFNKSFKNVEHIDQPASKHKPIQTSKNMQKTLDLEMSI